MRALPLSLLVTLAFLTTPASAEWGVYGDDGWPIDVDGVSIRPPGMPAFDAHGPGVDAVAPPVNVVGGTTVFPYWPVLTAEMTRLAEEHADLVKLHSIGKSTAGLDLWMLEIADFARIDTGEGLPLERREVMWVDGGTHSNEYSGVYFTAHLASFLLDHYVDNDTARWIVENRHTWLMPMVNPDGSNLFGRLNAKGVNINRNYPVIWDGSGHDAVMNNRGPSPASEPETQHNIEWFNKTRPDYYASVHCCGNLWLYPYGEEGLDPVDQKMLQRVCDEAFARVRDDCGPIWSTIYPASGSSVDTVYEYTGAVAFGYEMSGRGAVAMWGQPFTTDDVREQEVESWEGVLHAFRNVHRYGAHPVLEAIEATEGGVVATIRNIGLGDTSAGTVRLVDSDGTVHGIDLPLVGAGNATRVVILGPFPEGDAKLEMDYVKRLQASPSGTTTAALLFTAQGAVEAAEGVYVVDLGKTLPAEEAPGAGMLLPTLVLAALALLALRRRG